MKRGLVVLDHDEIPETQWQRRIEQVRAQLRAEEVEVALVYGDVFRSDDIAYLTNLCIYWNEGMLAIPADGDPALLTKLSPRVHTWMRRTSTLTDLRSGKAFGSLVAQFVADREPGTIGLVDASLWPTALIDEVSAAAPGWVVRPLEGLIRQFRIRPSDAEQALLRQAGTTLTKAADAATAAGLSRQERISVAERVVRGAGFTDVLVRATDAAVEITGQHRNSWLRIAREVEPGEATTALRDVLAAVTDGATIGALAEATAARVRVVHHADLSTDGEYASQSPDRQLAAGDVVVVSVENDKSAVADTILITESGAENLTGKEV
ncbi:aminopeptidase P family N-terminal domain-containing protein [Saccharopolyspora sp. 5N708]|uniref:aminopeptidase P family N-terminal domain-containing protein n=1 Tax=Saccharopolyspora sp. 5N708 TaxID=3457424 RepID=UPI003FD471C0